jgi:RecB family exonuclease
VTAPREVRLVRAPSLHAYQQHLAHVSLSQSIGAIRDTAVLVPTRAAAGQLRRTIEQAALSSARSAVVLPDLFTRADWYERLRAGLPLPWLTAIEREAMLQAAAHAAITDGIVPPFRLRPALVGEMLALYDDLRRHQQRVEDFERLLIEELEPRAPIDRGAERMLRQTAFLAAAFRTYEARVRESGALDEHLLRGVLIESASPLPHTRVIVTVGDRGVERGGLWPADFDLLSRAPGLRLIDVLATEEQLAAGFHERVHALFPGIEEVRLEPAGPPLDRRTLLVPAGGTTQHFVARDREEEVASAARRIKGLHRQADAPASLDRVAIVFARPLPYLYLARGILQDGAVPFQCDDALPLGAEPAAAALDVVITVAAASASRAALVELLRSPHFTWGASNLLLDATDALARALAGAGYSGDPAYLLELGARWADPAADDRVNALHRRAAPALAAAVEAVGALGPLFAEAPASVHLDTLHRFLQTYASTPAPHDPGRERTLRARTAILSAIASMRSAVVRHGDLRGTADDIGAALRRTIESETFAPRTGETGVHLVDATAARYGAFDDVHLVGLIEGEWPARPRRNLFYSPFLLKKLGWQADSESPAAVRAGFLDLLHLAARHTSVSTFQLEDDVLADGSALLDDVPRSGLQPVAYADSRVHVFRSDALLSANPAGLIDAAAAGPWLPLRLARTAADAPMFHGTANPSHPRTFSISAIDRYTQCPFQYFANRVLRLEEDVEDEDALTPRERGIFVHEVFQRFYEAWDARAGGRITPADLPRARKMLEEISAPLLQGLPPADAALERTRLLGSPVAPGIAELVLRMEAERFDPVVERRMEDAFDAVFELKDEAGVRLVPLRGVVDRIDLLEGGRLRIVDYKSSAPLTPLQLALYVLTTEQRLRGYRGREWHADEAAYIVFNAGRGVKPLGRRPDDRDREIADAARRTLAAVAGIQGGMFPPRPLQLHLCATCAVASVCRKDHVSEDREPEPAPAV